VGRIGSYRDIIAWQRARGLTRALYILTSDGNLARDRVLVDQIRRASISIMSNIAEGFGRGSNADFARFLDMAMGSANEVGSLLAVIEDSYAPLSSPDNLQQLNDDLEEIIRITRGLRATLRPRTREETPEYEAPCSAPTQDPRLKTQDSVPSLPRSRQDATDYQTVSAAPTQDSRLKTQD
jgi:four helix bundle protein